MAIRNYRNTVNPTSLTSPATNSATSLNVASTAGFPSVPFTAGLDRGTAVEELVLVTAVTATTMTVVRGYNATVAVAQNAGAAVEHCVGALDYHEANRHIDDPGRDDHSQYLTYARAAVYFPTWVNGTSAQEVTGTTVAQESNRLTIPSAPFARRVQVTSQDVMVFGASNVGHNSRITRSGSILARSRVYGTGVVTLLIVTDWLSLPANTSHTYLSQVWRESASGGALSNWSGDPNENKITALVVPA
jgi:hypothetical protein